MAGRENFSKGWRAVWLTALVTGCAQWQTPPATAPAAPAATAATPVEWASEGGALYETLAAEMARRQGAWEAAAEHYLAAAERARNPELAALAAQSALQGGQAETGLRAARLWTGLDPDSLQARRVLAVLLLLNGYVEEAEHAFVAMIREAPEAERGAALREVATWLLQEADPRALAVMQGVAQAFPEHPEAAYALAGAALEQGDLDTALAAVERALQQRPDWVAAQILRAEILQRLGRTEAALTQWSSTAQAHPERPELQLAYAEALVSAGRAAQARPVLADLEPALRAEPDQLLALGLVALEAQAPEVAERALQHLWEIEHRRGLVAFSLGRLAEWQERHQVAQEWYRRVTDEPYRAQARIRAARLHAVTGDPATARRVLQQLRGAQPELAVPTYLAEGDVLVQQGQLDAALALYDAALAERPDQPELLYARGMVAQRMGQFERMERDLQRILAQDPGSPLALNALGYTWADQGVRLEQAMDYIQRAFQARPDDPAVIDSLGWIHYRLGRVAEAERYLQRAFDMLKDPEIAAHLGEVLWVQGQRAAAQRVWQEGLRVAPDNDVLHRTMERFLP